MFINVSYINLISWKEIRLGWQAWYVLSSDQ